MSLGVRLVRSRPGCPQDNGGHERMHADMSGDVQSRPGATLDAEQRRLSRWRQDFNHVRPHDALGGKVPADLYKVAELRRPKPVAYVYPAHVCVRRVYRDGQVSFRSDRVFVSEALGSHDVGLEPLDAMHVRAWFRDVDLGVLETVPDVDASCFDVIATKRLRRAS